jgi:probable HAF family extracellular repeat protein
LGTFGGTQSFAYAINNSGQVVGVADLKSGPGNAFLYSGGIMTDLGTLPGDTVSNAYALNNSAQVAVVGYSTPASGVSHAFLWQSATGMQDLGNLGGTVTTARAVNNPIGHVLQAVGDGNTATGDDHAWIWQQNGTTGTMTDLNTDLNYQFPNSGWALSIAYGINDNQQIVGTGIINGQEHGFLWKDNGGARPTDLGANVFPRAINGSGQVAGYSAGFQPFLWTSTGGLVDLGAPKINLPGPVYCEAYALNNSSPSSPVQVVGTSYNQDFGTLWQSGKASVLDLQISGNSCLKCGYPGGSISYAYGVNDNGWIVGFGSGPGSSGGHAVLLTPITKNTVAPSTGQAPVAAALPAVTQSLTVSQATPVPAAQGGGQVLPATDSPDGYSLTDMARAIALFNTSGNNPAYYPNTPFQILYVDPATESFTPSGGGVVETGTNSFVVAPDTQFYVPLLSLDDSPPILGTFPTDPNATANYVFGHDQVGATNLAITVDGQARSLGAAYAAGPVQTPPLLDGGGTHFIAVGAFLSPLSPGTHTVTISGLLDGLAFQQGTGLSFLQFQFTYTVTVM